jgi:CHASE2 domain-containing sensor protein
VVRKQRRHSPRRRAWRDDLRQWFNAHELLTRYAKNVVVAVVIEVLLVVVGPLFNLPRLEDNALDFVMRRFSNTSWIQQRPLAATFGFLDVDEETYRRWGTPVTPRHKLKQLIDYAARSNARVIVVDFDLNRSYDDLGEELGKSDIALADYLANYDSNHPPLILVRRLVDFHPDERCPQPHESFLDARLIGRKNVFWGSVGFDQDDDFIERRWRLWEPVCSSAEATVLTSVQLIAAALTLGGEAKRQEASRWVQQFAPGDCNVCPPTRHGLRYKLTKFLSGGTVQQFELEKDIELEAGGSDLVQRILFRIPFLGPADSEGYSSVKLKEGSSEPILTVLPAWQVTELEEGHYPGPDLVNRRIVIIGASYRDSGDIHATPLGNMPGAMVLINSIYSLMQYGQLRDQPKWAEHPVLAAGIFGVTWLFTRHHHFTGMIWSTIGVFVLAGGMSLYLFRQGRWLNFIVPLIAVQIHHFYESYHEYRHRAQENR